MDDIFYSSFSGYKSNTYDYYGYHNSPYKVIKHKRNINGESYYIINHPKVINLKTGNATFKLGDLKKYDKNFIFQYYDSNGKMRTILLGRKDLNDHKFIIHKYDRDEFGNVIKHTFFGAIKISDVFEYGREI